MARAELLRRRLSADKPPLATGYLGEVVELPGLDTEPQCPELFWRISNHSPRRDAIAHEDLVILAGYLRALTGSTE